MFNFTDDENKNILDPDTVCKDIDFGEIESDEEKSEDPMTEETDNTAEAPEEQETEKAPEEKAPEGEEAPDQENAEGEKPEETPAEPAPDEGLKGLEAEEIKALINEHFQNLRTLIKYTKQKDENVGKLASELQKYREDYCKKTFKSIATLIISYREDCRRSILDIKQYQFDNEKSKKYLSYLYDDYAELISNAGCEEDENGEWLFNGKKLSLTAEAPKAIFEGGFEELPEVEDQVIDLDACFSLKDYLSSCEEAIKVILANNETIDKCMKEYIKFQSAVEEDFVLLLVIPAVRRLISIGGKLKARVDESEENENADCIKLYEAALEYLVNALEDVLRAGGVDIYTTCDDTFDPKKNRLMRPVEVTNPELDRRIAKQYTECYMLNDNVIYPAKVDVYKYQKPQE